MGVVPLYILMSILESMLPGFIAFIRQGLYKADVEI